VLVPHLIYRFSSTDLCINFLSGHVLLILLIAGHQNSFPHIHCALLPSSPYICSYFHILISIDGHHVCSCPSSPSLFTPRCVVTSCSLLCVEQLGCSVSKPLVPTILFLSWRNLYILLYMSLTRCCSLTTALQTVSSKTKTTNSVALSPQANYTD
jgi:hypothetical protein